AELGLPILIGHAHLGQQRHAVAAAAFDVLAGGGVLGLDHQGQRPDGLQIGLPEVAEGLLQVLGPLPLPLVALPELLGEDEELGLEGGGGIGDRCRVPARGGALGAAHWRSSSSTRSSSSIELNGFVRYPRAPASSEATSVVTSPRAVSMRTLVAV